MNLLLILSDDQWNDFHTQLQQKYAVFTAQNFADSIFNTQKCSQVQIAKIFYRILKFKLRWTAIKKFWRVILKIPIRRWSFWAGEVSFWTLTEPTNELQRFFRCIEVASKVVPRARSFLVNVQHKKVELILSRVMCNRSFLEGHKIQSRAN